MRSCSSKPQTHPILSRVRDFDRQVRWQANSRRRRAALTRAIHAGVRLDTSVVDSGCASATVGHSFALDGLINNNQTHRQKAK